MKKVLTEQWKNLLTEDMKKVLTEVLKKVLDFYSQEAIANWRKAGAANKIPVTVTYYPHARIIAHLTF